MEMIFLSLCFLITFTLNSNPYEGYCLDLAKLDSPEIPK